MNPAKLKERELIIKLLGEGKTCRKIADLLGVSKSKVSFWNKRFQKTDNLNDKPRSGKPTPLSKKKLKQVAALLRTQALKSKSKAGFSSKEVLQLLEQKTGKKYTLRHTQRLLHKMGLSLITPRRSHIRKDEQAIQKFRVEFKKNSSRNMWVIPS